MPASRLRAEFGRVLGYLPRHRRAVALGLLSIPLARALDLLVPWIIGRGVDELLAKDLSLPLGVTFLVIAALALVKGAAKFAMRQLVVGASRRFEAELKNDIHAHLLALPPDELQAMRTGDLMARMTGDVEAVRMLLGPGVMYLVETLFMLPALVVLVLFDPALALFLVLPLLLIAWGMHHYAGPIHDESTAAQERLAELSNAAQEDFAGVRIVRAFAAEPRRMEEFAAASREYLEQNVKLARARGRSWTLIVCARDLGFLVLLGAGCYRLMHGALTLGQFWVFISYLNLLFWPMIALGWMVGMIQRGRASLKRLNDILDRPPALGVPERPYRPERVEGRVSFRQLRAGHDGAFALDGIDLEIPAGTVLGITGATGAGKSTLAQVLPRLVDVQPGQAFVDGVDVTRWDPVRLRRAIGLAPQDAFLFADSMRANVGLGRDRRPGESEAAADAALAAALATARVDREIAALPGGLAAVVGERGVTLSGGQRQRATIARALAAEPAILIFDDCLSAVDAETEARILTDLARAAAGRTCLLISHRVAALGMAARVVVLENGRVVEDGTPAELLALGGRYHRMHRRQQAEDELERL